MQATTRVDEDFCLLHKNLRRGYCSDCNGCKACPPCPTCKMGYKSQGNDGHRNSGAGRGKRAVLKRDMPSSGTSSSSAMVKKRRSERYSRARGHDRIKMIDSPVAKESRHSHEMAHNMQKVANIDARKLAKAISQAAVGELLAAPNKPLKEDTFVKIVSEALEQHGESGVVEAEASSAQTQASSVRTLNFEDLPRPSHRSRMTNKEKVHAVFEIAGVSVPKTASRMPPGGYSFLNTPEGQVKENHSFQQAKCLLITMIQAIALWICPDHSADIISVSLPPLDPVHSGDLKLRNNTIKLATDGDNDVSTMALAVLASSYSNAMLNDLLSRSFSDVMIGTKRFGALRKSFDIMADGMSIPKRQYIYRIKVPSLANAMRHLMTTLELRAGTSRSVNIAGHVFTVPVYDRGGKSLETLYGNYCSAVIARERIGYFTFKICSNLLTRRGELKTSLSQYYYRLQYALKFFEMMMDRLITIIAEIADQAVIEGADEEQAEARMTRRADIGSEKAKCLKSDFAEITNFLGYEYGTNHLKMESTLPCHCCRHAVNKARDRGSCINLDLHNHEEKVCVQCAGVFSFFGSGGIVEEVLGKVRRESAVWEADDSRRKEVRNMISSLPHFEQEVVDYAAHQVRGKIQDVAIKQLYDELKPDGPNGIIEFDHKQKVLPRWYREAQPLYFGKKGMSLGGFMLVRRQRNADGTKTGLVKKFFDIVVEGYSDQDHKQVAGIIGVVLDRINVKHSALKSVTIKTDNASCMTHQAHIPYFWNLNKAWSAALEEKLKVDGWVMGEASKNKGDVDGHFAYVNVLFASFCEDGNDITCEEHIFQALQHQGGIRGSTAMVVDAKGINGQTLNSEEFKCKTGVRSTHHIKFCNDGVRVYRQSILTEPELIPAATLNAIESNHLCAAVKKRNTGNENEFVSTCTKPPKFKPDKENDGHDANHDDDDYVDPDDIVPATSMAQAFKAALEQVDITNRSISSPATNNITTRNGIIAQNAAGWAYKQQKRHNTLTFKSAKLLQGLENVGKQNKKARIPFQKQHTIFLSMSECWTERLTMNALKVKTFTDKTPAKIQEYIDKLEKAETENRVLDVEDDGRGNVDAEEIEIEAAMEEDDL